MKLEKDEHFKILLVQLDYNQYYYQKERDQMFDDFDKNIEDDYGLKFNQDVLSDFKPNLP